ncbi:MAG: hypothetical protein OQK82_03310 [Candidatus Pacearchaeota archaeon]|nr:hypothetical protein [Candidatus Pacearchaeota archaeon]
MGQVTLEMINRKLDFLIDRCFEVSDEVLSKEAEEAVKEGLEAHKNGTAISGGQLRKELGIDA